MKRLIDLDELLQYPLRRGSEHYDEKNADPHFLFGVESVLEYAQTLPTLTKTNNWISVEDRLPEDGKIVETKIDDGKFIRNIQKLKRKGNLWFLPDGSMYVYYSPTHWKL